MHINLEFVRQQFPALVEGWVFFDNAGGSQILQPVVNRISDYLLHTNVQLGASYEVSVKAGERVLATRRAMADVINAADAAEIVMGSSTTLLMRILSLCIGQTFQPGDEIIITNCDHEANIGAWAALARQGMTIKVWKVRPDTLDLHLDDLRDLLTERTRLVTLTHASNILGTINPIKEIASVVHEHGALICVDGVAYAPHRRIDVQALDVDFYAFSFYKTYGPHYALLYGKQEHFLKMPGLNHYFIDQTDIPYKFQPGNVNFELSYGMLGFCDYIREFARIHDAQIGEGTLSEHADFMFDIIAEHEETLSARLLDFLNQKPNVRIIGKTDSAKELRVPTVSFVVEGMPSDAITSAVDPHRIAIRYGDFYARRLIETLGLASQNGVVRVSMVHYNTLEEVERLIRIFEELF